MNFQVTRFTAKMIAGPNEKPKVLSPMDDLQAMEDKAFVQLMQARNVGKSIRGFSNQIIHLD